MFREKYNGNGNGKKPTPKQIKTGARGSSIPYQPKAFSETLTKKSGYSASDRASATGAAAHAAGKEFTSIWKRLRKQYNDQSIMTPISIDPYAKAKEKFNKKKASNDL